jgi:hypothetical protein
MMLKVSRDVCGWNRGRKLVDNISPGGWAYYNNKCILPAPYPYLTIMTPQVREAKTPLFTPLPQPKLLAHGYIYIYIFQPFLRYPKAKYTTTPLHHYTLNPNKSRSARTPLLPHTQPCPHPSPAKSSDPTYPAPHKNSHRSSSPPGHTVQ